MFVHFVDSYHTCSHMTKPTLHVSKIKVAIENSFFYGLYSAFKVVNWQGCDD